MKKRLLSLLLAVIMIVGMLPVTAMAASMGKVTVTDGADLNYSYGNFEYAVNYIATSSSVTYTITLNSYSELGNSITIGAGKNIILDLNGYDLCLDDNSLTVAGNLTIVGNGGAVYKRDVTSNNALITVKNGGKLTISGGEFRQITSAAHQVFTVESGGSLLITNGLIKHTRTTAENLVNAASGATVVLTGGSYQTNLETAQQYIAAGYTGAFDDYPLDHGHKMQWSIRPVSKYAVTYDITNAPVGATASMIDSNSPYLSGAEVTVLPVPVDVADWVFDGWNAPSGLAVTEGKFTMPEANVEFTGTWKEDKNNNDIADETETKYTVTYDSNGATSGSVPVDDEEYLLGEVAAVLGNTGNLTKDNYEFKGWSLIPGGEVIETVEIAGNTTLYAKWDAVPTTSEQDVKVFVLFTASNGAAPLSDDILAAVGTQLGTDIQPNSTPKKWLPVGIIKKLMMPIDTTDLEGALPAAIAGLTDPGVELFAAGVNDVLGVVPGANWNINYFTDQNTAEWRLTASVKVCTVTFDSDGGSDVASQYVFEGRTANEPAAPTKEKYAFLGWYIDKELTEEYDFDRPVTDDMTLYAKWEPTHREQDVNVLVRFVDSEGNPLTDAQLTDLDAQLTDTTMEWGSNGLKFLRVGTIPDVELPIIKDASATDAQLTEAKTAILAELGSVVLHTPGVNNVMGLTDDQAWNLFYNEGSWRLQQPIKVCTVTFDSDGGSDVDSQYVVEGRTANEPAAPTKEKYAFLGWYIDKELTEEYDFDRPVTDDMTLYAKWEPTHREQDVNVLVRFVDSEGNPLKDDQLTDLDTQLTDTTLVWGSNGLKFLRVGTIPVELPIIKGASATDAQLTEAKTAILAKLGSVVLHTPGVNDVMDLTDDEAWNLFYTEGSWRLQQPIKVFTVTYDANGAESGTVPVDETMYVKGDSVTLAEQGDLAKEGYAFTGWSLSKNGAAVGSVTIDNSDVTLYACWAADTDGDDIPDEDEQIIYLYSHFKENSAEDGVYLEDLTDLNDQWNTSLVLNGNKNGWITIGYILVGDGQSAQSEVEREDGKYVFRYAANEELALDVIDWDYNLVTANGAPGYVPVGTQTTHLNGTVTLYTVTYTDGIENAEIFADQTTKYLLPGDETPKFVGVPQRIGYDFVGWKPVVAATVTKDVTYVAQWELDLSWILLLGGTSKVKGLNTDDHVAYVVGRGNNQFVPNGQVTRAEAATMFFRLMTDKFRNTYWYDDASYSDVADTAWYNVAVATLENAGIIQDTLPGGKFRPNEAITRAELAVMAAQFCTTSGGRASFYDVPVNHWAYKEIALVQSVGWIEGFNGNYRPEDTITRAECVTIINRMLERGVESENMLPGMVTFVDNAPTAWYYEAVQEAANSHTYSRTKSKLTGEEFNGERWLTIEKAPDWAALEQLWASANK